MCFVVVLFEIIKISSGREKFREGVLGIDSQPNGTVHFELTNTIEPFTLKLGERGGGRLISNPMVPFSLQIAMEDIQLNGAVHFTIVLMV